MRINWTLLCNQVSVNSEGTYNIFGVTEDLLCATVPCEIGQLAVVICARVISPGRHYVWVIGRLARTNQILFHTDPAGHPIVKPEYADPFRYILPIYVQDLTLPEYGLYTLDFLKNDSIIYSNSFYLRPIPHPEIKQ